jgi:hypothetical protein
LINLKNKAAIIGATLTLALVGCGGFVYTTVGGNVKGLTTDSLSSLTLANEGNFTHTLTADGPFSFKVASNGTYSIRVYAQPNPVNCTVVNGAGTMSSATPISNIAVNCVPNVPVSGILNGMVVGTTIGLSTTNTGLVQFSKTQLADSTDAMNSFILPTYAVNGQAYDVTVASQPAAQVCSVINGKGTADNTNVAGIKNVAVNCVAGVPVGVTLAGLKTGLFITLTDNANDPLLMTLSGTATFNKSLLNGAPYAVTITTQPVGQTCTVTNGTGTAVMTPVTAINVEINCI